VSFRLAVLVSGEGSNLQAILDSVHGQGDIVVAAVGSNKEAARGLERARAADVPTAVFAKEDFAGRPERDAAMGDWLESYGIDLLVLAGFMEILTPGFVRRFGGRMINVHPSLLPSFQGLRPIQQAIDYGVRQMGVTVHFVVDEVDTGPILLQEAFEVDPYALDVEEIESKVHAIEHELLPRAIRLIAAGAVRPDPDAPGRRVIVKQTAPAEAEQGGSSGDE
jgi:phosphoribosylglycinamide formyltransferase-1